MFSTENENFRQKVLHYPNVRRRCRPYGNEPWLLYNRRRRPCALWWCHRRPSCQLEWYLFRRNNYKKIRNFSFSVKTFKLKPSLLIIPALIFREIREIAVIDHKFKIVRMFAKCHDFFLWIMIFKTEQSSSNYSRRERRIGVLRLIFLFEINLEHEIWRKMFKTVKFSNCPYHDRV